MNGRNVSLAAFELKESPRVPVTLIGGGSWYVHWAGKTFAGIKNDPQQISDIFVRAVKEIGHDLLWTGSNFINYPIHLLGCDIQDYSSDGPVLLNSVIKNLEEKNSPDMRKVVESPLMQGIILSHHLVADQIGKETMLLPTHWGPLTTTARILGGEETVMAMVEDADRLVELIRFSTELIWSVAERTMEHPDVLGMNISEPFASGDMISPDTFRTFSKPFLRELVERVAAKGKYSMIHICGDTTSTLEDVLEIRPNCFSLESKVDLVTAKSVLGGKVCVAGNVSPTGVFLAGSPDQVIAEAKACVEKWGDPKGFLLTLGCDFPKTVPMENIRALMSLKES